MPKSIELKDVHFSYSRGTPVHVLKGASLSVKKGEFVGIIGGTGQGKTTLLLCFNGLIPHFVKGDFKGDVFVDGINSKHSSVSELSSKVGLVFQKPDDQIFSLEVEDEIKFGPKNLGLSEEEVDKRFDEAVQLVGIESLVDKETNSLSAGQKQLVCIASVLSMEPEVIVLDEPTAELDFQNSRRVYSVLKELHERGKTVVVVEHKMKFISSVAERMMIINDGKIIADGDPGKIFSDVDFLSEIGIAPPTIRLLESRLNKEGMGFSFSNIEEAVEEIKKRCSK